MAARDLKKESLWRRAVQRQEGSGLSVRAWCRKHHVKEAAFYWWRKELARREAEQPMSFVPVHIREDHSADDASWMEIVLADGRCVRVRGRVNRQVLADVLAVLGSAGVGESEAAAC